MYNLIFSVWKENVKLGKFYDYSDFELHGTSSDFIKKKCQSIALTVNDT